MLNDSVKKFMINLSNLFHFHSLFLRHPLFLEEWVFLLKKVVLLLKMNVRLTSLIFILTSKEQFHVALFIKTADSAA